MLPKRGFLLGFGAHGMGYQECRGAISKYCCCRERQQEMVWWSKAEAGTWLLASA